MKKFLALSLSDVVFIMLVNVKMPTIVGILTFMSRINLCSAELSMESFITLGPGCFTLCSCCPVAVCVLYLLLVVPWVGLCSKTCLKRSLKKDQKLLSFSD